jgi:hypothetical protein
MASKKKEQIYELLEKFLEKENLYLGSAGYNPSNVAFLKKISDKEENTQWYMKIYKEARFYNLSYTDHYFDFIDYLFKHDDKLAIMELNAKKPNKDTNDWFKFFSTVTIRFQDKPEFLFDFMVKESFFKDKSNFSLIENLCDKLSGQDQKEAAIQMLINMEYFQIHDYQLKIHKLTKKHLKNSDEYASYFTKLKAIEENIDFNEGLETFNTVKIWVSLDKLKNYNLNKTYDNETLIKTISRHMDDLAKNEIAQNRLGIQHADFEYHKGDVLEEGKKGAFVLTLSNNRITSLEEQQKDMTSFINEYLRIKLKQEYLDFTTLDSEELKKIASTVLYKKLDNNLEENTDIEPVKMKI